MTHRIFGLAAGLAVALALTGTVRAGDYAWPLDAPPALTSTFAEYRSGRFHAGLDIRTWGKEGYPCLAVADGYVWRIRTSPWGYGKVVYLRLADGRTAVYAHLSAFAEEIDAVLREEQDRRGSYSVNLFLEPGRIPVKRGDVVAYTGSTGSGFPHLHFEIRDENQRPLNPLTHGFPVEDTIAPTLVSFALIPLDAGARVNGSALPQTFGLRRVPERDVYAGPADIEVVGAVGVALKVHDRADASALSFRLAPYRVALGVGDREVFEARYTDFSYDDTYLVDLDRNFVLNQMGQKGYHNLYLASGNDLPFYGEEADVTAGVLDVTVPLEKGINTLRMAAQDAAGNTSVAEIAVRGARAAAILEKAPGGSPVFSVDRVSLRTHTVIVIQAAAEPSAALTTDGRSDPLALERVGASRWEAVVDVGSLADETAEVVVRSNAAGDSADRRIRVGGRRIGRSGGEIVSADGAASATFKPASVYAPLVGSVTATATPDNLEPPVGNAYRFEPETVPFADMVQVMVRPPEDYADVDKLGLYELTEKGWTFVWNDRDTLRGTVGAGIRSFSTYALLRDDTPPVLTGLTPSEGSRVAGPRPEILVGLEDAQSGIHEEENIEMTLDGRGLIFEYDPEANRATAVPRWDLTPGDHIVAVRVRDTNGNEARASARFTVVGD